VIVPDVNLLLYAVVDSYRHHEAARRWWEELLAGAEPVGLTAPVVFGFIRIATNRRIFDPPMTVEAATEHVREWLAQPPARLLPAGPRHLDIAFELLEATGSAANLTTDVQIAAAAIEYGAEVHSNDTDFARIPGVRWRNPLA